MYKIVLEADSMSEMQIKVGDLHREWYPAVYPKGSATIETFPTPKSVTDDLKWKEVTKDTPLHETTMRTPPPPQETFSPIDTRNFTTDPALVHVSVPAGSSLPPIARIAPTVSNAKVAGQLDSRGIPHDSRIHSAEGTKNTDGSWRNRRAVDKNLLAQVEAELFAAAGSPQRVVRHSPVPSMGTGPVAHQSNAAGNAGPGEVYNPPPPPAVTTQVHTPPPPQQVAPPQAAVEPVKSYENVTIPQGQKPAHSLNTFKSNLTLILAQFITEKKITQEYIQQLKDYFQIKEIWNILGDEQKCMQLFQMFVDGGMITKIEG